MGLAVVHGIVKSLKGAISVSSQVGQGLSFTVYLPLASGGSERIVAQENQGLPGGREHILFVDDEKPIIELNSALLKRMGYDVTATASSTEALALCSRAPGDFDIVITDQAMPEMTGIDRGKRIRAQPTLRRELARTIRDVLDAAQRER
jgi:PleD family two-component response regulator